MRIIGLDIATSCGVATGDSGTTNPESFVVRLKKRGQGPEVAATNIFSFLLDHLKACKAELVCIEQYMNPAASKNADSTILQLMCFGAALCACKSFGARVEPASPATIRKHFCGHAHAGGREATKRMVLTRARLLGYLPPDCDDDNRADALAIWDFACAKYGRARPEEIVLFGGRP